MTTAALWAAVDALTQPRQIRLTRDNGQHDWTQTPSLWQQLTDALPTGQEQGTGGHSSSYRTPISVDCLDLRTDIHTTVLDALHGHDQHPRRNGIAIDIPASIRHLASIVIATNDDDLPLVDMAHHPLVPEDHHHLGGRATAAAPAYPGHTLPAMPCHPHHPQRRRRTPTCPRAAHRLRRRTDPRRPMRRLLRSLVPRRPVAHPRRRPHDTPTNRRCRRAT